jgi:SAM-dependent methyltransferase
MIVELGPGTRHHPLVDLGIDLHHPIGMGPADATVTPWGEAVSGRADVVYSSHFMEHVPHGYPLIHVMNQAWEALKPGGSFFAIHPVIGFTDPHTGDPRSQHIGWQPWADPTHVSFWWLPEAYLYFCEGPFKPNANYGMRTWGTMGDWSDDPDTALFDIRQPGPSFWSIRDGWEAVVRLIKP